MIKTHFYNPKAAHKKGEMNKTETAYSEHLECLRASGAIKAWYFEPMTLNLSHGNKCSYTPDFMVVREDDVLEFHEVKGFWQEDARVKIKTAAELFPFVFIAATRKSAKSDWQFERFTKEEKA